MFGTDCTKLHVCQHYIQGDCRFGTSCKRAHNIHAQGMKVFRGFSQENIQHLHRIYRNKLIIVDLRTVPTPGKEHMYIFGNFIFWLLPYINGFQHGYTCRLQYCQKWQIPLSCLPTQLSRGIPSSLPTPVLDTPLPVLPVHLNPQVMLTRMKSASTSFGDTAGSLVTTMLEDLMNHIYNYKIVWCITA